MRYALVLFLLVYFCCCASQVVAMDNETRELRIESFNNLQSRVVTLINASKMSDIATMYNMTSRKYREKNSLEKTTFLPIGPTPNLLAYFIEAIRIDGDEAFVTVSEIAMHASLPTPKLRRGLIHNWVKEAGTWNYDPKPESDYSYPDTCGYSKQPRSSATPKPCGR